LATAGTQTVKSGYELLKEKTKDNSPASAYTHNKPELQLLQQFADAGEFRPVCLVDTFEHLLNDNKQLKSRLDFRFQTPQENSTIREMPVGAWLLPLFHYLQTHGWCIVVAGRVIDNQKNTELQAFNPMEIKAAIHSRPELDHFMNDYSDAMIRILSILSFNGNPLWLHLAMNKLERLLQ
jgi:hypothetical protein